LGKRRHSKAPLGGGKHRRMKGRETRPGEGKQREGKEKRDKLGKKHQLQHPSGLTREHGKKTRGRGVMERGEKKKVGRADLTFLPGEWVGRERHGENDRNGDNMRTRKKGGVSSTSRKHQWGGGMNNRNAWTEKKGRGKGGKRACLPIRRGSQNNSGVIISKNVRGVQPAPYVQKKGEDLPGEVGAEKEWGALTEIHRRDPILGGKRGREANNPQLGSLKPGRD